MSFDFNVAYSSRWGYSLINTFKLKKNFASFQPILVPRLAVRPSRRETLPLPKCQLHAQGLRIAGMSCPLSAGTLCSQSSQMGSTNQWRLCNQVSFSDGVKHLTHVPVREARQVPNSSEMLVLCPRLTWLLTPFKPTIVKKIKTIHFLSRLVSIPAESVTLWYLANSSGYIQ